MEYYEITFNLTFSTPPKIRKVEVCKETSHYVYIKRGVSLRPARLARISAGKAYFEELEQAISYYNQIVNNVIDIIKKNIQTHEDNILIMRRVLIPPPAGKAHTSPA